MIRELYIETELEGSPLVDRILSRAGADKNVTVHWVDDVEQLRQDLSRRGEFVLKDVLVVKNYKGEFLSRCPGTDGMVCCNYFVINTGPGCTFDCHYCFLQSFMNTPYMTLHGNLPEMFSELERKLAGKQQHFRVGTGEYADSLAMEELTGISAYLVEQFAGYENLTLELKTKSAMVDSLLDLEHNGNTVIAWSLNPQSVIDEVEPGTASLQERLDAAVRAADAGYRLAFHLDPVVYTEDWKREYSDLIETIGAQMRGRSIDWFSLGAFRYSPALKEIIQMRFPKDKLTVPEMIQGADGKYRYFKTIRRGMFDYLTKKINEILPGVFHYLCMETRSMWEKVYGEAPRTPGVLEARFEKNTKNSNPAS